MNEYIVTTIGKGLRFAIVVSRFNEFITSKLVTGACEALRENGVADNDIDVYWCPGALEIPALAARLAEHGDAQAKRYDAIVCAGCVIKGETDHYTFVASEAMRGVSEIAMRGQAAVGNAILTVHEVAHAIERSGDRTSNKGWEAAMAALAMANQLKLPRQD
ncbi:MAG: 6,7-dimethyl-8-ribityllumazine synthase [bacterium]|nr:6,7-dimethyl-8-ribityllumazine synthase [Candidatus Sumerlaeota bacterium]